MRGPGRWLRLAAIASLAACSLGGVAVADPVADFYHGRTVTLVVGSDAGGAYDVYARLLARHITRYIPGSPTIIIQNMAGAGSVIATNHVYSVAPQDGTVILAPIRTAPFATILGQPGAQYDATRINWLGSLNNDVGVMQIWGELGVRTLDEARRRPLIIGSTAPMTDSEEYPALLNNTLGTKFKLVRGYPSINAIQNALERGEVQGQENSYLGMAQHFPDWRRKVSVLVQLSLTKHPDMPDIPLVFDYIKPELLAPPFTVEEVTQFWQIILTQQAMGRPYGLGPKVPPERVQALRAAFKTLLTDAEFKADAARSNLEIMALDGGDIQAMIERVGASPPEIFAKLRELILYKGE